MSNKYPQKDFLDETATAVEAYVFVEKNQKGDLVIVRELDGVYRVPADHPEAKSINKLPLIVLGNREGTAMIGMEFLEPRKLGYNLSESDLSVLAEHMANTFATHHAGIFESTMYIQNDANTAFDIATQWCQQHAADKKVTSFAAAVATKSDYARGK